MTKRDARDWVAVASTGDDEEATLIAGFLRAQGIETEVEGPSLSPFPEDLGAMGASRVMVPPERAEEARELIARQERDGGRGAKDSDVDEGE